ncbi:MAG TPA: UDP-N-acetylmuramate dehydrogenase [Candidatus Paceibacterota bacterium]|nr:UDP-N-acetylmuramate dehydrogenase [Candidatus Paceibacterota bacterium]HMP19264.1 UDP-N-acetylmuramate dehydrogenase [Candidatus Paceibacterota bacterium]HMP85562.1 UDP-N-acetylmuramate dehydrogenase [Candidatus Paceibacterota bacterium]
MKITENANLKEMSFMKIGGTGKFLIEIENEKELHKISEIHKIEKLPIIIVGEGSNTIFGDGEQQKIFVKIKIDEILKVYQDNYGVNLNVSSGTNWDKLVEWSVKQNLSGLELLSAIPGSVGASPIQNIGAYGQEVSNVITHIKAFDIVDEEFYEITNSECDFGYRDSFFKKNPNRYIITNVSFRLSKTKPETPKYKDLALYFLSKKNKNPTLREIRKAVIDIRNQKLANPKTDPNCGSFFKNPIVKKDVAQKLINKFSDMPHFPAENDFVKLSGGWLIEKSGFKGKNFGTIRVSDKNALVLISNGNAKFKELIEVKEKIILGVEKNFGVILEVEPNLII